jgi:glyoxylase-like metal-dependent hydrolase (beta-lactamase superfamily II)
VLKTNVLCEETNFTPAEEHRRPSASRRRNARDRAGFGLSSIGLGKRSLPGATWGGRPAVDAYRCRSPGVGNLIESAASERFGQDARPAAIVMTHGHFDRVGVLEKLAEKWDAPIYAHEIEVPYLNGTASYPPPDSMVGGGIMPWVAQLFPRGPINVSRWLEVLPDDGSVPGMPGWRWLHTPGHAAGHVSLWRESDRAIIAGDAFITTRMESAYAVAVQKPEMHGPPTYFTTDFEAAKESVQKLANLETRAGGDRTWTCNARARNAGRATSTRRKF